MQTWALDSRIDRVNGSRQDETWVSSLWKDESACLLRVTSDSELPFDDDGELRVARPKGSYDQRRHFLIGLVDDVPWFATQQEVNEPRVSGRSMLASLGDVERELVMAALALVNWHKVAPYCGQCGCVTLVRDGGSMRVCPSCQRERFPRTDPAAIVAVMDAEGRLLLAHNSAWKHNRRSLLAGFVDAGESLEQAVRREVWEEVGLRLGSITYLGSQPWPFPRSLMIGFVAQALEGDVCVDAVEIDQAKFWHVDEYEAAIANGHIATPTSGSIAGGIIEQWRNGTLAIPSESLS